MIAFRSFLFSIAFYTTMFLYCILLLPFLLMPQSIFVPVLRGYFRLNHQLEKLILGLDFEIIGKEHLPKSGSYIVAAKHQSTYETLKLFHLFDYPAVIMKKQLMLIPIWGWIARKAKSLGIDRTDRKTALISITEGAKQIKKDKRPIIIFPQGTRVSPADTPKTKRYKWGVVRMAKTAKLDIVPLALNSGPFWPRRKGYKRGGLVTFEFLPTISHKLPDETIMKELQSSIEKATNKLCKAAKPNT